MTAEGIITVSYRTSVNTKSHDDSFLGRKATIHSTSLIRHTPIALISSTNLVLPRQMTPTLLWTCIHSFHSRI